MIEFSENKKSDFALLKCEEPMDGEAYEASIKEMFPVSPWDEALNADKYVPEHMEQMRKQIESYIKDKGENYKVEEFYYCE